MNALTRPTTMAAEGRPRWRWTLHDIERMAAAGLFRDGDRAELIGGELVPMSPMGNHHEHLRTELTFALTKLCPDHLRVASEPQFNLAEDDYRQPDILVYEAARRIHDVRGPTALLVIEIADSNFDHDTGAKALAYAGFGVRDYWVIDAKTRRTRVFREPTANGFTAQADVAADAVMTPLLVPELAVSLSRIG